MSVLEISNMVKHFPGVNALDGVSLSVERGEIMALLGENGAGKSTLIKILSGALTQDSGSYRINGTEVPADASPLDVRKLGIATIYQELSLLPHLSVAENIFLAKEPLSSRIFRVVDYRKMNALARDVLATLKSDHVSVTTRVNRLSMPQQQMVEVAKALASDCKLVIMDEPTTTLTSEDTAVLFEVMRALRDSGVTIIFISHRLEEVFEIADRATVLRDGKLIGTVAIAESTLAEIISMMIGHAMDRDVRQQHRGVDAPTADANDLLRVENASDGGQVKDVSLHLRENEILGIAGLVGSGRTELARALVGASTLVSGSVRFKGRSVRMRTPEQALRAGLAYLSENRKEEGLNLGLSAGDNVVMADLAAVCRRGVIDSRRRGEAVRSFFGSLQIRGKPESAVGTFSGGNQQKVAIAKWLHVGASVIIFDEPTRGIDVAAKAEVHAIIRDFASHGRGAIVISSETDELVRIADRILVMSRGRVVKELGRDEISKDTVLHYATGGR